MLGIYKITNQVNGRFYIGSAIDIGKRWRYHIQDLNKGRHGNNYLQRAWNKYGSENFKFEVLEYCALSDLIEREQYYLGNSCACENGYNICPVAGSRLGTKMPLEAVRKSREANIGRKTSEDTKQKISLANKGKMRTPEMREKYSMAKKGIVFSEEHKAKLSEARKKRITTEETKRKISLSLIGNENNLGKERSEEIKRGISERMKGRKLSDKAKENIKNGWIKRKAIKNKIIV